MKQSPLNSDIRLALADPRSEVVDYIDVCVALGPNDVPERDRKDVRQEVIFKLLELARKNKLNLSWHKHWKGFISKTVRDHCIDEWRKAKTRKKNGTDPEHSVRFFSEIDSLQYNDQGIALNRGDVLDGQIDPEAHLTPCINELQISAEAHRLTSLQDVKFEEAVARKLANEPEPAEALHALLDHLRDLYNSIPWHDVLLAVDASFIGHLKTKDADRWLAVVAEYDRQRLRDNKPPTMMSVKRALEKTIHATSDVTSARIVKRWNAEYNGFLERLESQLQQMTTEERTSKLEAMVKAYIRNKADHIQDEIQETAKALWAPTN